jgi:hypothetical protein
MPLTKSSSKPAFKSNVKEMMKNHPQDVALAAAFRIKREASRRAEGGLVDDADQAAMMPETYANPAVDLALRATASGLSDFSRPADDPNDSVLHRLNPYVKITQGDVDNAIATGLATSGGGLSTKGIRAYHGSPYDFNAFSLDKIGTGEGAQAYGHGLYFAENEATAKAYRDALAGKSTKLPDGTQVTPQTGVDMIRQKVADAHPDFGQPTQVSQWVFNRIHAGKDASAIERDINGMAWDEGQKSAARAALKATEGWKIDPKMYEVQINADPEHFLDWDKPLSEQPSHVQDLAKTHEMPFVADRGFSLTGGNFYRHLAQKMGGERDLAGGAYSVPFTNESAATQELQQKGIPGIKYLDAGSRASGDGSRNYVVFDHNLIDIVKKYAAAGIALPPAIAAQYAASQKEQHMATGGTAMDLAFRLKRANGGAITSLPETPKNVEKPHIGPIVSAVPGRTDKHKMSVPPGSYVINADTVSHLGENNTMAGLKRLRHLFGPDGPYAPKIKGKIKHEKDEAVPVLTAGGEFVIAPEYVRMVGKGNISLGHKILDEFQKRVRQDHIKTLQSLPGPAQT